MLHFEKLATDVDIESILAELNAAPDKWLADTSRQRNVRCQRNTQNIFLRAAQKPLPPGVRNANDVHGSRTTKAARSFPQALKFCQSVADAQKGKLGRATLVALLPKSRVYPHVDSGEYYRIRDRFHLVLKSSQGSPLTTEDETVVMKERELWVFNNKAKHWADNSSTDARVHLIFDVLPPPGEGYYAYPSTTDEPVRMQPFPGFD